jgi:hypothetical protein
MDLGIKTTTYGGDVNILASAQARYVNVTLDETNVAAAGSGLKSVPAGTIIGKNGGTGLYDVWVPATAAHLHTGVVGNNNAIKWTAKQGHPFSRRGTLGHAVKVSLIDPAGNNQPLEVRIINDEVRVMLATGAGGAITSTAAEVIAAANGAIDNIFVSAANDGASTGAAAVVAAAAAPLAEGVDDNVAPSLILVEQCDMSSFSESGGLSHADQIVRGLEAGAVISARIAQSVDAYVNYAMPQISFR